MLLIENEDILLTGDIAQNGLEIFLNEYEKTISIVQIPHHGRYIKNTESMITKLKPEIAFVSGKSSSFHENTKKTYLKYNVKILKTFEQGAIILKKYYK